MQSEVNYSLISRVALSCGTFALNVIHSVYWFLIYLSNYLSYVTKHLKTLYFRTNNSQCLSVSILKEQLKYFSKIPKHIVIIIEGEDISYHDCVKLILWCIYSGIPFISFYSHSCAINPTSLYEVLCKRSKSSLQNIKWGKSFHKSVKEMAKKDINGYVWTPTTEVNLFSSKSVYDNMENVMLRLCHNEVDPSNIQIDTVDQHFKEELPLPDPCLGLVFGRTFSTFGFFPWQIRVTEFLHIPTHHNFQLEDFLSSLKRFARCQQRFGK